MEKMAQEQMDSIPGGRPWRILDFILTLPLVIVLTLGIRAFIFEPVQVKGSSMYPTLQNGQHMFCEKVTYMFEEPGRYDIVICRYPGYRENCVKRVIALPGETIEVRSGIVYVNGAPLEESFYWDGIVDGGYGPITVPEDTVFVMGDNRNNSKDSRSPSVGPIPFTKVSGKVLFTV